MGSSRANQQIELRQPEIGYRLGRRKKLYETRRRIADYTLLCAIFGIVVAVVEMEATLTSASSVYKKVSIKPAWSKTANFKPKVEILRTK